MKMHITYAAMNMRSPSPVQGWIRAIKATFPWLDMEQHMEATTLKLAGIQR